jgi:hypothetical protein
MTQPRDLRPQTLQNLNLFDNTRFRGGFTQQAGHIPARIFQGTVVGVNPRNWTIDFYAKYDRIRLPDIQVGSPYSHFSQGEGFHAMPEVGANCMVCLPSDSSPPFVLSFVMPMENIDTADADAPDGTRGRSTPTSNSRDASFAGGRPVPKPGDQLWTGRDGNYVILHRGGVLQIGTGPLCQRMYIPLINHLMDVSEQYTHHSMGGTIRWGIQEGPDPTESPTEHMQVFRIFANDKFADIRVTTGKVHLPIREPVGDAGEDSLLNQLGIGTDANEGYIVHEVVVAPNGFDGASGDAASTDTKNLVTFRHFFDRQGGYFLRSEAAGLMSFKKRFYLRAKEDIDIESREGLINLKAAQGIDMDGGNYTHIKGGVVRLGKGNSPVATQGSIVQITLPVCPISGTLNGQPFIGVAQLTMPANGIVLSGNGAVLA